MHTIRTLVVGVAPAVAVSGCARQTGIAAAADAMGATQLNSIQFSGSGSNLAFGQAVAPGAPWPRFVVKTYDVAIDYQAPAMRMDMLRAAGRTRHVAAAPSFAIDQRTTQVVSGKFAWRKAAHSRRPTGAVSDRLRQLWLTPHGGSKQRSPPTPPPKATS